MNRTYFNYIDVKNQIINEQIIERGNTVSASDTTKSYFIYGLFGSVTLKDKDSNTVLIDDVSNMFNTPIRLDEGFEATGTNITVVYAAITMKS